MGGRSWGGRSIHFFWGEEFGDKFIKSHEVDRLGEKADIRRIGYDLFRTLQLNPRHENQGDDMVVGYVILWHDPGRPPTHGNCPHALVQGFQF